MKHRIHIHALTLFPGMFDSFTAHSMMKRAIENKILTLSIHNIRDYSHDKHKTCDDKPFGGGPGMLMKPEPIFEAVDDIFGKQFQKSKLRKNSKAFRFIHLTPKGKPFSHAMAKELASVKEIVFLCGHYEGIDQRVVDAFVTDEISIGDYVLTGGELPAMVVADAVVRLVPGVLGSGESKEFESFSQNLLEYPQYTRPALYRGMKVPQVLLSGNHKEIELWRQKTASEETLAKRPDLLKKANI